MNSPFLCFRKWSETWCLDIFEIPGENLEHFKVLVLSKPHLQIEDFLNIDRSFGFKRDYLAS